MRESLRPNDGHRHFWTRTGPTQCHTHPQATLMCKPSSKLGCFKVRLETCSQGTVYMCITSAKSSNGKGNLLEPSLLHFEHSLIGNATTPTSSNGSILHNSLVQSFLKLFWDPSEQLSLPKSRCRQHIGRHCLIIQYIKHSFLGFVSHLPPQRSQINLQTTTKTSVLKRHSIDAEAGLARTMSDHRHDCASAVSSATGANRSPISRCCAGDQIAGRTVVRSIKLELLGTTYGTDLNVRALQSEELI